MKSISQKDLTTMLTRLEKLQEQADKICKFVERKINCTLEEANEYYDYDNPLLQELLAIKGSIEGAIENAYNI